MMSDSRGTAFAGALIRLVGFLAVMLLLAGVAGGTEWTCPECGATSSGQLCASCGLIEPPEGMVYIPGGSVELEGEILDYEPFFIDSAPATYRDVLPWLNSTINSVEEWALIITGQFDQDLLFLKFTPFTSSADGTSITVPASCFDIPAGSFTWEGARHFLSENGKRLPSRLEMLAALEAGLVQPYDVYSLMSLYENVITSTLGSVLGSLDRQAMFTPGLSSPEERVMWEWTRDSWRQSPDEQFDIEGVMRLLFKPVDPPAFGFADRDNGYFNVAFRGAVPALVPGTWVNDGS